MLNQLRRQTGGLVAKIFIALLVLSFAVWGVADIFSGAGRDTLIEAGETEISSEEFRLALDRQLNQLSQQAGRPITLRDARQFGLDRQVLGQLVTEAVLDESARRMALGASDQAVAQEIMRDPTFQTGGQFDRDYFNQLLRANGIDEQDYVNSQRGAALRQQLIQGLVGAQQVPDTLTQALARYQAEQRTVSAYRLGPEAVDEVGAPDDEALADYFENNQGRFAAPEYRALDVLKLDEETLAASIEVSEDEVREVYESEPDRFGEPERRVIDQIIFASAEAAEQARTRIEDGASFEAVAEDEGLDETDYRLGTQTRDEVVDPAVAETAFSLEEGEVSAPVEGRFGTALVRVAEIEEESLQPFEDVAGEIRAELAGARARNELFDAHDVIEDALAGGATLAEAASEVGVEPVAIEAADGEGLTPEGEPVAVLEGEDAILREAFEVDEGMEPRPITIGGNGYAWLTVREITPARDRELDEVREEVEADWRADALSRALAEAAEADLERLEQGDSLEDLAEDRGVDVETIGPFARSQEPEPLSSTAVSTVFATPQGQAGSAPGAPDSTRVVFRVDAIEMPQGLTGEQLAGLSQQMGTALADDLLTQYVNDLRDAYGVTVNQTALNQALGAS